MATRTLLLALIVLVATALQSAVVPHLAVRGARPDLPLVITVILGLVGGPITGMAVGFSTGLLLAALDGGSPGASAALSTLVGYLAGGLRARIFVEHWAVPLLAVAVLTFAAQGARGLLWRPEGWTWPAGLSALGGSTLYNAALAYPAFALLRPARRLLGAAPLA